MDSIRNRVYGLPPRGGMDKQAWGLGSFVDGVAETVKAAGTYLLAASLVTGIGSGWAAAKMTARNQGDMDVARKAYEDERLKADIGYLRGAIRDEGAEIRARQAPRAARVMG